MCFQCKRTGERICNPVEAEIKCMICNRCEVERLLKESREAEDAARDTE